MDVTSLGPVELALYGICGEPNVCLGVFTKVLQTLGRYSNDNKWKNVTVTFRWQTESPGQGNNLK